MVMPSMPASSSASFTASSCEGCRTASILSINRESSFDSVTGEAACWPPKPQENRPPELTRAPIRNSLRVEVVPFFAVLRKIEPSLLVLGYQAQAHGFVHNKEQHQRAHDRNPPCDADAGELIQDLAPMAVDGAGGNALAIDGIDDARRKDSGEQCAESASSAVDAKGVERIVVAEAGLDLEDHEGAEEAGRKADEQRRHGLHKSGSGRNGDKAGDCAGNRAERCRLAVVKPLKDGPAKSRGCCGEVGVDEGAGGKWAGAQ